MMLYSYKKNDNALMKETQAVVLKRNEFEYPDKSYEASICGN